MKRILALLISLLLLLAGCGGNAADGYYQQITQEEAKEMMDSQEVIILDVREQDEYDSGHIPGAVLLPVGSIDETTAAEVIPDKDSTVLVYCRSGNRSKTASSALAELGYTLRPVQEWIAAHYDRQLEQLEMATARQNAATIQDKYSGL